MAKKEIAKNGKVSILAVFYCATNRTAQPSIEGKWVFINWFSCGRIESNRLSIPAEHVSQSCRFPIAFD